MKYISHSPEETEMLAEKFLNEIFTKHTGNGNKKVVEKRAQLVLLSGDLGAGKTAFVKAVAKIFGITEKITSPTFVLEKIYKIPETQEKSQIFPFSFLIHIDAYRLELEAGKEGRELELLGWEKNMSNPENIIFLEWPEKVFFSSQLSDFSRLSQKEGGVKIIQFKFLDETTREIAF